MNNKSNQLIIVLLFCAIAIVYFYFQKNKQLMAAGFQQLENKLKQRLAIAEDKLALQSAALQQAIPAAPVTRNPIGFRPSYLNTEA